MRRSLAATVLALIAGAVAAQAAPAYLGGAQASSEETETSAVTSFSPMQGGSTTPTWRPDVRRATRYARRRQGDVRFAIVDLERTMHVFHGGRTAPAASVFKAMLLATYLRKSDVRDRDLRDSDRDLLRPMIRRSDNETASIVDDIVGRARIKRLARDAHMRNFRYDRSAWGLSRIQARDQARFFYRYERYIPHRHEVFARRLLSNIVPSQRWGIGQVVPDGWKLYFKGGWGTATGRVNHQVAFLERHGHRVALAMLTEFNPSHPYGTRTLEGLAKRLLRGLPRLPPGP